MKKLPKLNIVNKLLGINKETKKEFFEKYLKYNTTEETKKRSKSELIFKSIIIGILIVIIALALIGFDFYYKSNKNKNNTDHFISINTDNNHSYILYFITFLIFISAILYLVQNN